ncbi:hypothetical protein AGLY_000116 [Aphis glycines]|uniref:Uncharacterized protein n=1 Tax=Aphis glycines TaxID=307491 RepID=A0A6G0U626_APHGL|nr:hypothetical protein AGLY_000116 [Aphis glycines]
MAEFRLNINVTPLVPRRKVRNQIWMSPERRVCVHFLADQILRTLVRRLFDFFNRIRYSVEQICALVYDAETTGGDELVYSELFVKSGRLQFAYTDVGHLAAVQQTCDDGRLSGNGYCFARGSGLIEVVTAAAADLGTSDVTVIRSGKAFLSVFQNLDTGRRERIYRHAKLVGDSGRQAAVSGGRKQW